MVYIHHHLGLGDHIVCNAIVRRYCKEMQEVILAVKERNFQSVEKLYEDLDNIDYHVVESDMDCECPAGHEYLRIGFENCRSDWERSFYDQVGMDYGERFSGFFIDRDRGREVALESKLDLPERYAFVNRNASTGVADIEVLSDLPIVELKALSSSIFDWIGVLEKADEVHTIDSSIFQLVKQLSLKGKKVFYDTRDGDPTRTTPTFENDEWWIVE